MLRAVRLGIDLGTTRTVVVRAEDGRYPIVSFDSGGGFHEWIPAMCAELRGTRFHGWDAVQRAHEADAIVRSVKRSVSASSADTVVAALPSRPTAMTLLAEHVEHVISRVRATLGTDEPLSAMIAVPANATSRQRWLTLEAFRRADVEILGLVNEPTAAGIEYAHRHLGLDNKRSPKRYLVVYDLGGGTFDTSAISLKGRLFELLATEGIARLGGDDLSRRSAPRAPASSRRRRARAHPPPGRRQPAS
jgi:molecular chaperone DnaK (HSP70)